MAAGSYSRRAARMASRGWRRDCSTRLQLTLLPGTGGGRDPVLFPDGQWIGFFAAGFQLRKISVQGGAPVTVGQHRAPPGAEGC